MGDTARGIATVPADDARVSMASKVVRPGFRRVLPATRTLTARVSTAGVSGGRSMVLAHE